MSQQPEVAGWQIGRLRGTPVYLGRSWPVIAVVIVALFGPALADARPDLGAGAYGVAVLYALLVLLSVLVHEAAHALVGQLRGYRVNRIVADLWGGHTAYDHADTDPVSTAVVAVVGPLANGLLAVLAWLSLDAVPDGVPRLLVGAMAWSNGLLALFNLLPGLPLDGGYLVEAAVWQVTGSRGRGSVVAGWCGRVAAVLVLLWAVGLPLARGHEPRLTQVVWGVLIAGFMWVGAGAAIAAGHARLLLARVRVADLVVPVVLAADHLPLQSLAGQDGAAVVVTDADGRPWGVLDAEAAAQVPAERRPEVALRSLTLAQPQGWVVEVAGPQDDATAVLAAAQEAQGQAVLVRWRDDQGRECVGLVTTDRLVRALEGASRPRRLGRHDH